MRPTLFSGLATISIWVLSGVVTVLIGTLILGGSFFFRHFDVRLRSEKASCRAAHGDACLAVADFYERGDSIFGGLSVAQDYYDAACDLGSASGCWHLGKVSSGDDAIWSYPKQSKGYSKACLGGIPAGCGELGLNYMIGAQPDSHHAAAAFQRGCEGDDPQSCYWLGVLKQRGDGVPSDPEGALKLFRRACDKKFEDACSRAGP